MNSRVLKYGLLGLAVVAALAVGYRNLRVQAPSSSTIAWIYPVIPGHGRVHPRPDLPVRPDPAHDYRILVQVVTAPADPAQASDALERLARVVNLMSYSGVPPEHVHIVAVLDREAGMSALTDEAYRARFDVDHNPNLPVLHALRKAGVKLMVCGQALAVHGLPDAAIAPEVTVTLSALTDFVVYGQQGYSLMEL